MALPTNGTSVGVTYTTSTETRRCVPARRWIRTSSLLGSSPAAAALSMTVARARVLGARAHPAGFAGAGPRCVHHDDLGPGHRGHLHEHQEEHCDQGQDEGQFHGGLTLVLRP